MTDGVANLRPATAIGVWTIGALAVALIALAGDRTLFRAEPTSPVRMMVSGLALWIAIVWPIVTGDRLTRAFVVGQGAVLVVIAAATLREGIAASAVWLAVVGVAVVARSMRRPIAWTLIASAMIGGGAAMLLRTSFATRG